MIWCYSIAVTNVYDVTKAAFEMNVLPKFIAAIGKGGTWFLFGQSHPAWVSDWGKEHASDMNLHRLVEP